MRRVKTGSDVFDAAVARLVEVYEQGHTVVVSMSGGKDSGVCLELAVMAAEMTGNLPVNVVYREEEILYPGTHEYLKRLYHRPEINFKWLCAFQPSMNVFNRGNPYWWVCDPSLSPEDHVEQLPEYAIKIDELNIAAIVTPEMFPVAEGKCLIDLVGLRVSESAKRMLGLVSSGGHLTKIVKKNGVDFRKIRPIYDWTDTDVWKALSENKWDYNKAYDVMHRMGVPMRSLRIGPPTLNTSGADMLKMAASAWPRWFDRVCQRLDGVRQAAQFGALVCKPRRRVEETWKDCYHRLCIAEAPADWIRERSVLLEQHMLSNHARHSNGDFPDYKPCMECGGAGIASYRKMTMAMFSGDPFSQKLGPVSASKFKCLEPEFFRAGAGTWGKGKPTW